MDEATSWKERLEPMSGARWPVRCGHAFAPEDLIRLREGHWPRDADDRWAVWLDGDTLRCWRSGVCVYEANITFHDDGGGIAVVVDVLDDPAEYQRAPSDESELDRFEGVLSLTRRPREAEVDTDPSVVEA